MPHDVTTKKQKLCFFPLGTSFVLVHFV